MTEAAEFDPVPGAVERLEPGLRRVLAPNPSPMTERGTNSYLLGEGDVTLIDPGPADRRHFDALLAALAPGERIVRILVTHAHLDHSPLARPLAEATGAPVLAFGGATAGRSDRMARLAAEGLAGGGEGVDAGFTPDLLLADGDRIEAGGAMLEALWTPGHFGNHLCFAWGDAVFTGDQVMGWAPSLVSPPDGDLAAFMDSTERLAGLGARVFHPGHGAPVTAPAARAREILAHRRAREAQILEALAAGPADIATLVRRVYPDLAPALRPAAARNVFAHLVDLVDGNRAAADPRLSPDAVFGTP